MPGQLRWCAVRVGCRTVSYLLGCLFLVSAVVGCSSNGSAAQGDSPDQTSPVNASTTVPLAETNIERKTRRPDPDATAIALTSFAVSRAGNHDQAVLTFAGAAVPGWSVQYVDAPVRNGTGEALQLPGQSWLEVLVLETPGPFTNPAGYTGPPVVFDNDTPQINTIQFAAQAAGITQLFVNINGARPNFSVSALTNPTRIVIDVAD